MHCSDQEQTRDAIKANLEKLDFKCYKIHIKGSVTGVKTDIHDPKMILFTVKDTVEFH
jgi:hypothetical protein